MTKISISVPSIVCEGCGDTIAKAIQNKDQTAQVNVDLITKTVSVETDLSETMLKNTITQAGHTHV